MYKFKFVFLSFLCSMNVSAVAKLRVTKYVYQKDLSEHCRRRVMPSVFLGNHVVEANSQILHFSQLEVPYSCFISIRTETGGNIILVIKVDQPASNTCSKKNVESPVKVFGMGNTFGGYWGPLPDMLTTSTPYVERFYTLKSTTAEAATEETVLEDEGQNVEQSDSKEEESPIQKSTQPYGDTRDYIRQIIPIVNITGHLTQSNREPERAFAEDDTFDIYYNVKREPGKVYMSSVVPLMQFSMAGTARVKSDRRAGAGQVESNVTTPEPRFDFEYDFGSFTLDPRLKFAMSGGKPVVLGKRYRPLANRRLNFRKNKDKLFSAKSSPSLNKNDIQNNNTNDSWSYIEGLLKDLDANKLEQDKKENQTESKRFSALLQRVADWQHNYSAYLSPNLTLNDPLFLDKMQAAKLSASTLVTSTTSHNKEKVKPVENVTRSSTKVNHVLSTETMPLESSRIIKVSVAHSTTPKLFQASTNILTEEVIRTATTKVIEAAKITSQKATDSSIGVMKKTIEIGVRKEKVFSATESTIITSAKSGEMKTNQKSTSHEPTIKSIQTVPPSLHGSMADHASWENVVQVAPKIANILNPTKSTDKSEKYVRSSRHKRRRRHRHRRRKRSIQAIPIELARPHNLTTEPDVPTTPEAMYNFLDKQDFAQFVELADDEIQGHLALRYMRRFVGATMYDICDKPEKLHTMQVLFFNSSRIVLALNNFTLTRMTVIATPARSLPFQEQRCNVNSLECQVDKVRVCVSNLNACDGVPNCGANDIYDEDRLLCGEDTTQHNVYLAAFTFLAVLLTMLYTVHYWLKRCVPKVSEAFFIYTDGTENILYLNSIMRSPLESDRAREVFHGKYFEDDLALVHSIKKKKSIWKKIFRCHKKKPSNDFQLVDVESAEIFRRRDQAFSFAEMEINNLTNLEGVDVAVQTGESLEMPRKSSSQEESSFFFQSVTATQKSRTRSESIDPRAGFRDIRLHLYENEEGSDRRNSESSELKMLNFLREAKLSAERWNHNQQNYPPFVAQNDLGETELKNTILDRSILTSVESARGSIEKRVSDSDSYVQTTPFEQFVQEPLAVPGPSSIPPGGTRRIRFNEALTSINHEDDEDNLHVETSHMLAPEPPELAPEPVPSGRDFRRFWTSKGKKDKSKQKKQLHLH